MSKHIELSEEEQRAEIAHGLSEGNLFCAIFAWVDHLGNRKPIERRVSKWRRGWRFRLLALAAAAALMISGSKLL